MKPIIFDIKQTPADNRPIDWIENIGVSVTNLFPNWMTAEIMLTDFVKRTGSWIVGPSDQIRSDIHCGLEFPLVWNLNNREWIPMFEIFPPEDKPKVLEICEKVMDDYLPDLKYYMGQKVTEPTLQSILAGIKAWEGKIICNGGRPVKEELAFRLGLWGIYKIKLGVEV